MPIGLDMPYGINHTDHLESSTIITDQSGTKVEELLYYPFGEILTDTSPTKVRYKYAGHEFDSESQLIYMGARYYDPKLARFVSPDPLVPVRVELYNYRDFKLTQFRQLTNPQAFNRYSYVVNNPIVFRDPLGLWTVGIGVSVHIQLGPVNFNFSGGFAVDGHATVATFVTGGGGLGVGALFSGGVSVSGSNAKTVNDLGGPFTNGSLGGGWGANASGDYFTGDSPNGWVTGGGVTVGAGLGAGGSSSITGTKITPLNPNSNSPTNAVPTQTDTTTNTSNNITSGSSTPAVQPPTGSSKKPGSTETEYVPLNFLNFSNPTGQSGGSLSITNLNYDSGSSGGNGGGGPPVPAPGYNPGN